MESALSQPCPVDFKTALSRTNLRPWQDFKHRQNCAQAAASKPLPGESRGAFLNGAIKVADKSVHRIVPSDFVVLEALNSPLLKMMEQSTQSEEKRSELEFKTEQEWEICYVFTTDAKSVYRFLKDKGVEELRKVAHESVMDWDAEIVRFVTLAVIEQLKRHVETKVKLATDLQKEGEISFFQVQKS